MENYTSDSSDSDGGLNKILDYSHLMLDVDTLDHNLDYFINADNKPAPDVETIILSFNRLETISESICKFMNLKILDVSSNGLKIVPDILMHCPLSSLILKNNNLTNDSLPKTFSVCSTLKEFNLSGNNFTTFPEQILDLHNLKYLYLGGNQIPNIPRDIWKLSNMNILSMGGNKLSEVPSTLGQLKQLQALVLCDNLIESLPPQIANLYQLKSLFLHRNRLRTLPPEIIALKNLTELSLRENPLVVRFVSDMTLNPASLLELAARAVKIHNICVEPGDLPCTLMSYLDSAHRCVNPKCKGVFFDNRVEHIKFVDFCGKYRIPLLQYLCSSKCIKDGRTWEDAEAGPSRTTDRYMMRKVLLG